MQAQIRLQGGAIEAVTASFAAIDAAYKRLHPFHNSVLEGVSLTLVYMDAPNSMVYLASSGGCQVAACSLQDGKVHMVSSPTQQPAGSDKQLAAWADIQTLPLDSRMDGLVLGSSGLWCDGRSHFNCTSFDIAPKKKNHLQVPGPQDSLQRYQHAYVTSGAPMKLLPLL